MTLKNIDTSLLPDLLRKNFGQKIFDGLQQSQHLTVRGFAGSVPALITAELFVTTKKNALFLLISGQFETFASVSKLEGDVELLKFVVASCNQFNPVQSQDFNIVEP